MKLLATIVHKISYLRKQLVSIPPSIFYATVRNTQDYNLFIPWCKQSLVTKIISPYQNWTTLTISFNNIKQISYLSHVIITQTQQSYKIESICKDEPLLYLESVWIIQKQENASLVLYSLNFQFKSILHQLMSSILLRYMGSSMWDLFCRRAEQQAKQQLQYQTSIIINSQQKEDKCLLIPTQLKQDNLQQFLQRKPQLKYLYTKHKQVHPKIHQIFTLLNPTNNHDEKIQFQMRNIFAHFDNTREK